MTRYETEQGRFVFAAGTIQWSWGLDDYGAPGWRSSRLNAAAQRITNLLARAAEPALRRPVHLGLLDAADDVAGRAVVDVGQEVDGAAERLH